jgi:NAD(P)H-dependent FMN reductase
MNNKSAVPKHVLPRIKNILGLVASPRQFGNCELFTKEISRYIEGEYTLKLIRLTSLNIKPCKGCYACIADKPCPNEDDMEFLLHEITAADAVVITSPVYYLGANSIIKKILDRGFLFFTVLRQTFGKPCILLNFYGIKDRIGVAPQMLETMAIMLGLDIKASLSIQAALPGEAVMNAVNINKAKKLAGILFSLKTVKNKTGCPFCGCEIIRIVKKGFICTLCHGSFRIGKNGAFLKIKEGGVLGPLEHLFRHKTWLGGMKSKFLAKRKEIMRTIIGYKDIGQWIEPTTKNRE